MMGSLLLGIILVLMSGKCLFGEYITQRPPHLDLVEGDSGTISCTVQNDLDIRSLSFIRRFTIILQLCIYSTNASNLSFSGTFQNMKCERETAAGEKSTCKVREEPFSHEHGDHCSPPPRNSLKNVFDCGNYIFASIWVNRRYENRIDLSGTIKEINLTLKRVNGDDIDSYTCRGNATGGIEDFTAKSTQLSVTEVPSQTGVIIGIILGVCVGVILLAVFIFFIWKKKHDRLQQII
ncbi:uncharacterized protein ACNLHF_018351 isoform 2-T3 [Anomaloglossus baeobatrachus]|uniref:uncharacterized protein LOC142310361 isoform X2 n=1 Tax=Anomaloglossus baeobatrachus TaxID=238106 RepID=UPI003F505CBE